MTNNQPLYDKANGIMGKINSLKKITKKLLDDKKKGISIDKKEIINIAHSTKKLMENYGKVLDDILASHITYDERERIAELLEETERAINSLEDSIKEANKTVD